MICLSASGFPSSRSGGGQGWGRCRGIGPSEGQLFPDLPANQVPIVGVTCAASRQASPVMSAPAHYRLMQSILVALVLLDALQIGRASCRERGCQYVEVSVGAVAIKK